MPWGWSDEIIDPGRAHERSRRLDPKWTDILGSDHQIRYVLDIEYTGKNDLKMPRVQVQVVSTPNKIQFPFCKVSGGDPMLTCIGRLLSCLQCVIKDSLNFHRSVD